MKNTMITEFVKFDLLQTTTEEQLLNKADLINEFLQKQDGFIDVELVVMSGICLIGFAQASGKKHRKLFS
jgi:hypothetical protein